MKRLLAIAIASILLLMGAAAALAQEPPPPIPDEKVRKRIEMLYIWRLTEALDLDDRTAEKLFPVVRKYERQIHQIQREQGNILKTLNRARQDNQVLPKKRILELVDLTFAAEQKVSELRRQQLQEVSLLLDDARFQTFIITQIKFGQEIKGMIHDARGRRGQDGQGWRRGPEDQQPPPGGN